MTMSRRPSCLHRMMVKVTISMGFASRYLSFRRILLLGYVNNDRADFGSILRFVEHNFGIKEGALNFADARATSNLTGFFKWHKLPRTFQHIAAPLDADYFLNDKSPMEPPDID